MTKLINVNSDGGPILLGDSITLAHWRGINEEFYEEISDVIPFHVASKLLLKNVAVWDFGGAGTCYLVKNDPTGVVFLRYWSDRLQSDEDVKGLWTPENETVSETFLTLKSGILQVMWIAESGNGISPIADGKTSRVSGKDACVVAVTLHEVQIRSYHYFRESVEVAAIEIRDRWK